MEPPGKNYGNTHFILQITLFHIFYVSKNFPNQQISIKKWNSSLQKEASTKFIFIFHIFLIPAFIHKLIRIPSSIKMFQMIDDEFDRMKIIWCVHKLIAIWMEMAFWNFFKWNFWGATVGCWLGRFEEWLIDLFDFYSIS